MVEESKDGLEEQQGENDYPDDGVMARLGVEKLPGVSLQPSPGTHTFDTFSRTQPQPGRMER
jgi:hypothetical protein